MLLSGPWPDPGCVACSEGAPLVSLDGDDKKTLGKWYSAAIAAGAWTVVDSLPTRRGAAGREAELDDVTVLEGSRSSGQ